MADDEMLGDTPKATKRRGRLKGTQTRGRLWKHSSLRDLQGLVTEDDLETLFVFTLVRNPWDRAVSYYHWLQAQGFEHPAVTLAKAAPFEAFVSHPHTQASLRAQPYPSYVTDWHGQDRCAAYIRLEHLAEDLAPLEAHLGFGLQMPHVNRSERVADYRAAYSDSAAEAVAAACGGDIARFGYSFEGSSSAEGS